MNALKALQRKRVFSQASLPNIDENLLEKVDLVAGQKFQEHHLNDRLLIPSAKKVTPQCKPNKYLPKFEKPDVESLISMNNKLKKNYNNAVEEIRCLKVKVREQEAQIQQMKSKLNEKTDRLEAPSQISSPAYTLILKNRLQDVNEKLQAAENQIKTLRRLPNVTVFEENKIEREELQNQNMRLTAKISVMHANLQPTHAPVSFPLPTASTSDMNGTSKGSFQKTFLNMLKEENERLKGTIRLLENDKVMIKATQVIQMKKHSGVERELAKMKELFEEKILTIEKLTEENRNLLFKKEIQFQHIMSEDQKRQIRELNNQIEEIKMQKKKIQAENNLLIEDNKLLKERQKAKALELLEIEQKYEHLKVEFMDLENKQEIVSPHIGTRHQFNHMSAYQYNETPKSNHSVFFNPTIKSLKSDSQQKSLGKSVKFNDIALPMLIIISLRRQNIISSFEQIFPHPDTMVSFSDFQFLLRGDLLNFSKKQCSVLANYVFEDHCELIDKVPHIKISLAITIIQAAVNKKLEHFQNEKVSTIWRFFLNKRKQFISKLNSIRQQFIESQEFFDLVLNSRNFDLSQEEISYIQIIGFSREKSVEKIILNLFHIREHMQWLVSASQQAIKEFTNKYFDQSIQSNALPRNVGGFRRVSLLSQCPEKRISRPRLSLNCSKREGEGEIQKIRTRYSHIYSQNDGVLNNLRMSQLRRAGRRSETDMGSEIEEQNSLQSSSSQSPEQVSAQSDPQSLIESAQQKQNK